MSKLPPKIFSFKLTKIGKRLIVLQGPNKPLTNLKYTVLKLVVKGANFSYLT